MLWLALIEGEKINEETHEEMKTLESEWNKTRIRAEKIEKQNDEKKSSS